MTVVFLRETENWKLLVEEIAVIITRIIPAQNPTQACSQLFARIQRHFKLSKI